MSKHMKLYSATWCSPCSIMKAVIEHSPHKDKIEIIDIDTMSNEELNAVGVVAIPTSFVYLDNKLFFRHEGQLGLDELNSLLEDYE